MVLHVTRDRCGVRRLTEIAVLRRGSAGQVQAQTVWRLDHGRTGDADDLQRLLRGRASA